VSFDITKIEESNILEIFPYIAQETEEE